ncbi:MAG TPA: class I SAM-dependent methyltransferase [Frateuria sp.]|uniref:class I SAM-dependent methyltransferase n=1 Tax=Frateuria sp. TaxID=2211372 RepID=UPI002DF4C732|nr:class I SAM-dependent methyltransferase [Frateuria sp.]
MSRALHDLLGEIERDRALLEPGRLRERGAALDRLETLRIGAPAAEAGLRDRIEALCAALEAVDGELHRSIRQDIRRGAGAQALLGHARAAGPDRDAAGAAAAGDSYDHLDTLVSGVLQIEAPVGRLAGLAREMVFYQPTPARHLFDLLARTGLGADDVLIDLGSGLGQVALIAAICSGARCIGIEWEASYVQSARRCAQALHLDRVSFVQGDARTADLSAGTVFYLYTPFEGAMLREVLDRLKAEASTRELRICTLGPCTATVAREPWLQPAGAWEPHRPAVFRNG